MFCYVKYISISNQNLSISDDSTRKIAYILDERSCDTALVWLPGFKSDMASTKATALAHWAHQNNRTLLRFDYSGHGQSSGNFADGTISQWLEDALQIIEQTKLTRVTLVGSSMGGWLSLLIACEWARRGQASRLAGLVLIAPAIDFTEKLMWQRFSPQIQQQILQEGVWLRPTPYSDAPMPITRALIEDGRKHLLFGTQMRSHAPVHILQGMQDPDVPYTHALELVAHLASDEVVLTLIKSGDHRLSNPQNIELLFSAIAASPK